MNGVLFWQWHIILHAVLLISTMTLTIFLVKLTEYLIIITKHEGSIFVFGVSFYIILLLSMIESSLITVMIINIMAKMINRENYERYSLTIQKRQGYTFDKFEKPLYVLLPIFLIINIFAINTYFIIQNTKIVYRDFGSLSETSIDYAQIKDIIINPSNDRHLKFRIDFTNGQSISSSSIYDWEYHRKQTINMLRLLYQKSGTQLINPGNPPTLPGGLPELDN